MIRAVAVVLVTAWAAWMWHTWRQLVRKDERRPAPVERGRRLVRDWEAWLLLITLLALIAVVAAVTW